MAFLDQFNDDQKLAKAKANNHPNVLRWVGTRNTTSIRRYVCYMCDAVIDTESAKYAPTKHAANAIENHVCRNGKHHETP